MALQKEILFLGAQGAAPRQNSNIWYFIITKTLFHTIIDQGLKKLLLMFRMMTNQAEVVLIVISSKNYKK